jgi:hypothetical protein
MGKSATACDLGLRLTLGGCLPDFAVWSGYPSVAALTIDPEIDAMCQQLPHAVQQIASLTLASVGSIGQNYFSVDY